MTQDHTGVDKEEKDNETSEESEEVEILDAEEDISKETEQPSELEALKKEKDKTYDRYLRIQAEYDNHKRRTEKEKASERKYKSFDLANDIIPVLDNVERALQVEVNESKKGLVDGVQMDYNQLIEALQSHGVEAMDVEGKPFEPNLHHAVVQADEGDVESEIIVEELQKDYLLKDKVIRPAMVKVNK